MAVVASRDTGPRAVPLSNKTQRPLPSQQQQGPVGTCGSTCFRKETGRQTQHRGNKSGQEGSSSQESGQTLPSR